MASDWHAYGLGSGNKAAALNWNGGG